MLCVEEEVFDDVEHAVLGSLLSTGTRVKSTQGPNREIRNVLLSVANPRSRLSRSETRSKLFSCLGELFWYLAGSASLDFIEHYIPVYSTLAVDGFLPGAYGPRIGFLDPNGQFSRVISLLHAKPSSKRAVITLLEKSDLTGNARDLPCTNSLQFFLRDDELHLSVTMRSNDAYLGLPHDFFCFTMIQEIVACILGVELGSYNHFAASMHLYDRNVDSARQFINEGFQSTDRTMEKMPSKGVREHVEQVVKLERLARTEPDLTAVSEDQALKELPAYWSDVTNLLILHSALKLGDQKTASKVADRVSNVDYDFVISRRLREAKTR